MIKITVFNAVHSHYHNRHSKANNMLIYGNIGYYPMHYKKTNLQFYIKKNPECIVNSRNKCIINAFEVNALLKL